MRLAPHNDRGVVAIEFVLVLPALLIVLFSVMAWAASSVPPIARSALPAMALAPLRWACLPRLWLAISPSPTATPVDGPCLKASDLGFTFDPNHKVTATATIDNYPVSPVLPGLAPDDLRTGGDGMQRLTQRDDQGVIAITVVCLMLVMLAMLRLRRGHRHRRRRTRSAQNSADAAALASRHRTALAVFPLRPPAPYLQERPDRSHSAL